MKAKMTLAAVWIASLLLSFAAGWYKGVTGAARFAAESTTVMGYTGLLILIVLVLAVVWWLVKPKRHATES